MDDNQLLDEIRTLRACMDDVQWSLARGGDPEPSISRLRSVIWASRKRTVSAEMIAGLKAAGVVMSEWAAGVEAGAAQIREAMSR